jgi:hypothetical protein
MLLWGWKRIAEELGGIRVHTAIVWARRFNLPVKHINRTPVIEIKEIKKFLDNLPPLPDRKSKATAT